MGSPPLVLFACWSWRFLLVDFVSASHVIEAAFAAYKTAILSGLRNGYLIGSWSYFAVTLGWWPSWLLLWATAWQRID